jgi:branched-subunit amino acid ABC-type transport system permease component
MKDESIHNRTLHSMMITFFAGLIVGMSPADSLTFFAGLVVGMSPTDSLAAPAVAAVVSLSLIVLALWWHPGSETIARQWWEQESEQ